MQAISFDDSKTESEDNRFRRKIFFFSDLEEKILALSYPHTHQNYMLRLSSCFKEYINFITELEWLFQ